MREGKRRTGPFIDTRALPLPCAMKLPKHCQVYIILISFLADMHRIRLSLILLWRSSQRLAQHSINPPHLTYHCLKQYFQFPLPVRRRFGSCGRAPNQNSPHDKGTEVSWALAPWLGRIEAGTAEGRYFSWQRPGRRSKSVMLESPFKRTNIDQAFPRLPSASSLSDVSNLQDGICRIRLRIEGAAVPIQGIPPRQGRSEWAGRISSDALGQVVDPTPGDVHV